MINPEKLFAGEGGYVFVSHSHLDITSVRRIRNTLESHGLEPILFYLRSMDDGRSDRVEQLKQLIFDEIDAREFFLYVSSQNAARSKWVQDELAYVRLHGPQKLSVLDLEQHGDRLEEWLADFVCRLRVFISYARQDKALAMRLQEALIARDFRVYDMENTIGGGSPWDEAIKHTLSDVSGAGHVLVLITEHSIRSSAVKQEILTALEQNKEIVPIIVGNMQLPADWVSVLVGFPCHYLPTDPTDDDLNALIDRIKR